MNSTRFLVALTMFSISTVYAVADDRKPSISSDSETQNRQPAIVLPLDASGDVCYTMRMYKVKPTERLKDNETGRRGYTTCQLARDYQIRSADIRVDGEVQSTLPKK